MALLLGYFAFKGFAFIEIPDFDEAKAIINMLTGAAKTLFRRNALQSPNNKIY